MRKLLSNPLLWRGGGGWPGNGRQALLAAGGFSLVTLVPWLSGACGCTMFEAGALLLVLAAALLGGNSVYGAITGEREKKTLDSLRLTQLTPAQVVLGKLVGEMASLSRLLLAALPAMLVLATLGGAGLEPLALTMMVAAFAGVFASVSGIFVSSLSATTSQAVVAGWIVKGVWLLGTPVLDLIARAVLVQREPVPMFTALNPLAALAVATVPEAASGAWIWMVPLYGGTVALAVLAMLFTASRRLAADPGGSLGIEDDRVHSAWRQGWGPAWLRTLVPGLSRNATFLREVAFQTRTGGASWPGYLVYGVLFLAPFLYARAWAVSGEADRVLTPTVHPQVEITSTLPTDITFDETVSPQALRHASFARVAGQRTTLVFHGHEADTCFRLALYGFAGIPMPEGSMSVVVVPEEIAMEGFSAEVATVRPVAEVDGDVLEPFGLVRDEPSSPSAGISVERRDAALQRALHVGLTGTLVLFLLYLSIRCTGFLAGALTGEKDRRSWQDLALTGVPAADVLKGKLWGALVFTLVQMTVIFPVLSLYAFSSSLTLAELLGLYGYAVALAFTAGILGLWASAGSATTHQAHGRALGLALGAFIVVPLSGNVLTPVLIAGAMLATLVSLTRRSGAWAGWAAVAAGLFLAPYALSPLTAVVGFMPSLHDGGASLLSALDVAPANAAAGFQGFLGAMLVLIGLSVALWKSALAKVTDRMEGSALHADAA